MELNNVPFKDGDKKECCGCTACMSICPKNAITMKPDEKGFLYPVIDDDKCIGCGLCEKTCAFGNSIHKKNLDSPIEAFGIKHKNNDIRANSRSGGVFTLITDYVLEKNGCVFGAVFNDDFSVSHVMAETQSERDRMRGSKYVQSDMNDCFKAVKEQLLSGRLVAFSGTACQVEGLYSYLNKDYDNLITLDIICHGVPSPRVWNDYVKYIQKKKKGVITAANFRDKTVLGWDMHFESFVIRGKKYVLSNYASLFYKNDILRDSCFNCKYCNMGRPSDFTLADFWGVDKHMPGFNDNKGVSLLFVNTEKAKEIFDNKLNRNEIEYFMCDDYNFVHPNLKHPEEKPINRDVFWDEYNKEGIDYILKKYGKESLKNKLKYNRDIYKIFIKRKILKR